MPLGNPTPGYSAATEFTVSSIPWVTSSILGTEEKRHIGFPNVTKSIVVKNSPTSTDAMQVAFTLNGLSQVFANYFQLIPGESMTADVRVIDLWLSGSNTPFTVYADLTGIPAKMMLMGLTGSNGIQGVG
jgi:hypothetical protein